MSPSDGGSGVDLLNILISFLSMLISLPRSHECHNPCQHLDHQQQRTEAEDRHQRIQLLTVEIGTTTHMQRQVALDQVKLQGLAVNRLQIRGDGRGGEQLAETGMRATGECLPASVGPSSQLDHGSLLILQSSPGLPIGKRIAGRGGLMRARIHDRAR